MDACFFLASLEHVVVQAMIIMVGKRRRLLLLCAVHLGRPLEEYVEKLPNVRLIRTGSREGLIRARLRGAAEAKGPVLTFLDSHCECTTGWLEPLLDRIARRPSTVVCPVIDVLHDDTLEYVHRSPHLALSVGGFDWNLQFNWHLAPDRVRREGRNNSWDPVRCSPLSV
ncbi:gly-5 [Cordylochernes scorpioides]|uniref:Gly-5 n=1 Tax=Cordylochernes scorpioides TaxID=51811 RepID=A0ABY6KKR3_9ARAC|nr:gly-5 [Cordylochernes scorpioides]